MLFKQVGDYAMYVDFMDFILNIFMAKYMQSLQWETLLGSTNALKEV